MPTTSNFGWTTPADTDLVKDGASAIRTLGNGIDASFLDLKGGTTGQVLSKASNADLDFTWAADASGIPATIFDAKGDLIAASAADTAARLAVGTNGQVLTADSTTATGLKWAALPASGKLLQVVSATTTTPITISTTTLTDTGITATITPTAATSKILVLLTYCIDFAVANVRDMESKGRLLRGATTIADYNNNLFAMQITNASTTTGYFIQEGQNSISYLDNPATTSATTYKFQAAPENTVGGRSIRFQTDNGPSTITLFEIGA